jgi:hypothetical protein
MMHLQALRKISLPAGNSTVTYEINTPMRIENPANDTVAVYRGQVLYALYIGSEVTSTLPRNYYNETFYPPTYALAQARDYIMHNTTEWNVAIDPSTVEYHSGSSSNASSNGLQTPIPPLSKPTFDDGSLPMYMTASACLIDWPLFKGVVPDAPIPKENRKCLGDPFEAKLVPYGSAKLHMAELPTIELSGSI